MGLDGLLTGTVQGKPGGQAADEFNAFFYTLVSKDTQVLFEAQGPQDLITCGIGSQCSSLRRCLCGAGCTRVQCQGMVHSSHSSQDLLCLDLEGNLQCLPADFCVGAATGAGL